MRLSQLFLSAAIIFSSLPSMAIYPRGKIKVHNAKLISPKKDALASNWLKYISNYPKLLYKKDKDYKIDQYCSFEIQAGKEGGFDLDSIKLAKHQNNFGYNLKAIEFLRETTIKIKQKDSNKPIELEFIYYSF